tara:strand:+ start:427 stop:798 length:372 start_codon:yes stop_codon:yes gene_type:complete
MQYWFFPEIWREIKLYLFHNINIHGKHLKNNTDIKNYNKTMKDIPKLYVPRLGPRIVYNHYRFYKFNKFRFAKFIYKIPAPSLVSNKKNIYKLIIEYIPTKNLNNKEVRNFYLQNIETNNLVH